MAMRSNAPMSGNAKDDYREARDSWAEEGCLPEGLSPTDIREIEDEVRKKVTFLVAQIHLDQVNFAKVTDFMGKLAFMKKQGLINDRVYDESMGMLNRKNGNGIQRESD